MKLFKNYDEDFEELKSRMTVLEAFAEGNKKQLDNARDEIAKLKSNNKVLL